MPWIALDTAHGLENQHRHLGLGLVPGQRHSRDRRTDTAPRDVSGPSMVQGVRDHIILAFRAVTISRLQVPESDEHFLNGFFEKVLHCPRRWPGGC